MPPLELSPKQKEDNWDRRLYPPCHLFDDMTPRQGGYYPDNVVSKRKEVRRKAVVKKGFSIRDDVHNYVENSDEEEALASHSKGLARDTVYPQLVEDLVRRGQEINLSDLCQISKMKNPQEHINIVFRYIHILILGFDQTRKSSKRDVVNGTGGEPDAMQTLLKECSPLLLYMQHIDPLNIPSNNCLLASKFFKAHILPMQPRDLGRISSSFSKVVRWVVQINRAIGVILYHDRLEHEEIKKYQQEIDQEDGEDEDILVNIDNENEVENDFNKKQIDENVESETIENDETDEENSGNSEISVYETVPSLSSDESTEHEAVEKNNETCSGRNELDANETVPSLSNDENTELESVEKDENSEESGNVVSLSEAGPSLSNDENAENETAEKNKTERVQFAEKDERESDESLPRDMCEKEVETSSDPSRDDANDTLAGTNTCTDHQQEEVLADIDQEGEIGKEAKGDSLDRGFDKNTINNEESSAGRIEKTASLEKDSAEDLKETKESQVIDREPDPTTSVAIETANNDQKGDEDEGFDHDAKEKERSLDVDEDGSGLKETKCDTADSPDDNSDRNSAEGKKHTFTAKEGNVEDREPELSSAATMDDEAPNASGDDVETPLIETVRNTTLECLSPTMSSSCHSDQDFSMTSAEGSINSQTIADSTENNVRDVGIGNDIATAVDDHTYAINNEIVNECNVDGSMNDKEESEVTVHDSTLLENVSEINVTSDEGFVEDNVANENVKIQGISGLNEKISKVTYESTESGSNNDSSNNNVFSGGGDDDDLFEHEISGKIDCAEKNDEDLNIGNAISPQETESEDIDDMIAEFEAAN